jgi:hypothetical protein
MVPTALRAVLLLGSFFALETASALADEAMSLIQVRVAAVTEEMLKGGRKRDLAGLGGWSWLINSTEDLLPGLKLRVGEHVQVAHMLDAFRLDRSHVRLAAREDARVHLIGPNFVVLDTAHGEVGVRNRDTEKLWPSDRSFTEEPANPVSQQRDAARRQDQAEQKPRGASAQSEGLNASQLAWLHVPKTGTSFANTLVSWGCDQLDEDDIVDDSYMLPSGMYVPKFFATHRAQCENILHICSGHHPIADKSCNDWNAHKGNFVALFREPEQRLISGFHHDLHDYNNKNASLHEYATAMQGCTVRMLTGFKCGDNDAGVNPTMQEHAIQRIHEGFAFVGLTEQWALSVCLFHAMFGGECHRREFANVRPGEMHTTELYSLDGLNGFRDKYDGAVYAKAKSVFYSNLAKYNVNEDTCRSDICKAAPEAFE